MQVWSHVKLEVQPKTIQQLVGEIIQNKKRKQEMLGLGSTGDEGEDKTEE